MAFIYQSDVWCEECGQKIRDSIAAEGFAPEDPDDEASYDSDEYPKRCGDDEESDCPQHCAEGRHCINAIELSNGVKVGCLFGSLTTEGVKYVQDKLNESVESERDLYQPGNEVIRLWYDTYALDYDLRLRCETCCSEGCNNDIVDLDERRSPGAPFCARCWGDILRLSAKLLRQAVSHLDGTGSPPDAADALEMAQDIEHYIRSN